MLLTRLPLPLRGVRLACVRPAASVRSEPGSNSQFEMFDSGFIRLEVNQAHCVACLHTDQQRHGCPQHDQSVKVCETQLPESVSIRCPFCPVTQAAGTHMIRQDPAVCVSLPSNSIVKEQSQRPFRQSCTVNSIPSSA